MANDDDLIRRGDALFKVAAVGDQEGIYDAIAALPAVTPAPDAALSAERETVARLTEALADMIAVADQDEWHKATTGRQIVITNARAALTQKDRTDG